MSAHNHTECVEKNNYKVINCIDCGYWHVYPMPTEEELSEYYNKKYYEGLGDNRSMTDKLSDPDGFYGIQYEDKLRIINKYLPKKLPLSVLDIGSGYGDFLRFMKSKGWKVRGIEPSETAVKVSQKDGDDIDISCCSFSDLVDLDFTPSAVITLNSVLEHARDPQEILLQIRNKFLIPEGIVNIRSPNDFNFLQKIYNSTLSEDGVDKLNYWLHPPEHLNYWSHHSISNLLVKLGYRILYMTSNYPLELFSLMGEDYILDPELGKDIHLKRVRFEKLLYKTDNHQFKDALYESFAKLGIGREFEIFATPEKEEV